MSWHRVGILVSVLSVAAHGSQAQQQTPPANRSTQSEISTQSIDAAIKVEVNLVLVKVIVWDNSGKAVSNLTRENFQIFDDGKRQKISSFSIDAPETPTRSDSTTPAATTAHEPSREPNTGIETPSATPQRFLALAFDDLHMKAADSTAVHAAATKLFAQLAPTDRVAIYTTSGEVRQDFTGDVETLRATLKAIVPHPAKGEGELVCPTISYYQADLIENKHDKEAVEVALADAAANDCPIDIHTVANRILRQGDDSTLRGYDSLKAIVQRLSEVPGQRILVFVSPGFILTASAVQDTSGWIQQAVRSGVVVNTIDARGLYTADVLPEIDAAPQVAPYRDSTVDYQGMEGTYRMQAQFDSGQILAGMAAGTGGRYFHNRNDLNVAMTQALAAPEVSYTLGFIPPAPFAEGKYHRLQVKLVNSKRYQLQAMNGYYASTSSQNSADQWAEKVRDKFYSQDEIAGLPLQLKTESAPTDESPAQLKVLTHTEIRALHFRKVDSRNCSDLVLATGLFDTNGHLVDGKMNNIALRLQDSTLEKMKETGLTLQTVFAAKPGTYRVRAVLGASESDFLGAQNLTTVVSGKQSRHDRKIADFQDVKWTPPNLDAPLKFLPEAACNLTEILARAAASATALASNLEKFTAQEHIDYAMLDHAGMVEEYDSGSFQYVYAIDQRTRGSISREYRIPVKGSHSFPAAAQSIGAVAMALIFLPDLQADYEMKCEGAEERNGQRDWVLHFQQRRNRSSRTATFWADNVAYPGRLQGRAWISQDNFQVVHLEARLMQGITDIKLQDLAVSIDYTPATGSHGSSGMWLPETLASYWEYEAHRVILIHRFSDFQFFTVQTTEETRQPQ